MIPADIALLLTLIFAIIGWVGGYAFGHLQGEAAAKKNIEDAISRMK